MGNKNLYKRLKRLQVIYNFKCTKITKITKNIKNFPSLMQCDFRTFSYYIQPTKIFLTNPI